MKAESGLAQAEGDMADDITDAIDHTNADGRLDRVLVRVDAETFEQYRAILDQPPAEGFTRLMNAPKPWE